MVPIPNLEIWEEFNCVIKQGNGIIHSLGREAHMQKKEKDRKKIMECLETSNPFVINIERRRVMGYQLK